MNVLSQDVLVALEKAVADACSNVFATLDSQPPGAIGLLEARSIIYKVVGRVWSQATTRRNLSRSGSARLPPEVLCAVFTFLDFNDRVRASHVCHRWRHISLENPTSLWAFIPGDHRPKVISALLDRADEIPVVLENILLTEENAVRIGRSLNDHMDHIKALKLELAESYLETPERLWDALNSFAPLLEKLVIFDKAGQKLSVEDDLSRLFDENAPLLRILKLYDLRDMLSECIASTTIDTFFIGSRISITDVADAFDRFPNLSTLGLELYYPSDRADSDDLELPLRPPKSLQWIKMAIRTPEIVAGVLSHIVLEGISEIDICYLGWQSYDQFAILSSLGMGAPTSVELGVHPGGQYDLEPTFFMALTDDAGRRRTFQDLVGGSFGPMQCDYTLVVSLSLSLRVLVEQWVNRPFTTLPALKALGVVFEGLDADLSLKDMLTWDGSSLACPSLSNLDCSMSAGTQSTATISASDMLAFIRRYILPSGKLQKLCFHGFGAIDQASADLQNLASTVIFSPACNDNLLLRPAARLAWD